MTGRPGRDARSEPGMTTVGAGHDSMETIIQAIEVFALVTGVAYLVLEILQKNSMWVVGIFTSTACAFEFAVTHVWASMGLSIMW